MTALFADEPGGPLYHWPELIGKKAIWAAKHLLGHFPPPQIRDSLDLFQSACRGSFCCQPARDSIVLRSDFVEAIHHFATRPQRYNTHRGDQKGGHFLISSLQPEQARRRLLGR